jgi:hypothetical protein
MQCTSYYSNPSEQALLALQVREAEIRVAREELAFLQACGGVGEDDVRRLRMGLGMAAPVQDDFAACFSGAALARQSDISACFPGNKASNVVIKAEDVKGCEVQAVNCDLVSLKHILTPLITTESSVAQLCRRVRPVLERQGVPTFKRQKVIHVLKSQADRVLEVGKGVWDGLY